jgi:hypothetical protein
MTAHFFCLVQALHPKVAGLNFFYGAQTSALSEMMRSCKSVPHVIKMSALIYIRANNVIIKNAIKYQPSSTSGRTMSGGLSTIKEV